VREFNLDWQKGYEAGLSVGIANERDRIIKQLENIKNEPQGKSENWLYKVARTAYADATIRLIKGENK
jgi:hypothetical protein